MDPDLRVLRQARRPAVAQVAQPRRLALDADALVERQRFGDRVVIRRRMRADLLELADVARLARGGRRQRPQLRDLRPRRTYRKPVPIGASSHLCRLVP